MIDSESGFNWFQRSTRKADLFKRPSIFLQNQAVVDLVQTLEADHQMEELDQEIQQVVLPAAPLSRSQAVVLQQVGNRSQLVVVLQFPQLVLPIQQVILVQPVC